MTSHYETLSYTSVVFAVLLIFLNGALSFFWKIQLEKRLFIAAIRAVVQLSLIGLVLEFVFRWKEWYYILGVVLVMTTSAAIGSTRRIRNPYKGVGWDAWLSLMVSSWSVVLFSLLVIVKANPWYDPMLSIPIFGMVLGNSLNSIALSLDRFRQSLLEQKKELEAKLLLGATYREACRSNVQDAVRTGMLPTINLLSMVGLVSLPGMMTGQILAGVEPAEAVKYQIFILFLIASVTGIGTILVVLFARERSFTAFHSIKEEGTTSSV